MRRKSVARTLGGLAFRPLSLALAALSGPAPSPQRNKANIFRNVPHGGLACSADQSICEKPDNDGT
jgi:hypothetical protein